MTNPCPVPKHQRPLSEFNELKNTFGFSWTLKAPFSFFKTILIFFVSVLVIVSILVCSSFKWQLYYKESILWIIFTSFFVVTLWIGRVYFAWMYIYDRLMNATITYEESGWYDGQTWVKTNDILIQDRLIGVYEVFPILHKLKLVLMFCILAILISLYINLKMSL